MATGGRCPALESGRTGQNCCHGCDQSPMERMVRNAMKTDRKDAELLVRLLLAGSLRPVTVPAASLEAARDLARAREQVRADLARLRQRVSKLLLRYGRVYGGGGTWTQAHRRWLGSQRFEHA